MWTRRQIFVAASAAALAVRADAAHAQTNDLAAADTLFDEGKQLAAAGKLAEACARFEASLALVPQLGVELNLADCDERTGRTASAWLAFGDAVALARRANDHDRWQYAQQRQAALKPRLARLTITVAAPQPPDFVVKRDGVAIKPPAYDVAIPVDPGVHVIEATAGGNAWSTEVVIHDAEQQAVAVPALEPALPPPPVPPPPPAIVIAPAPRREIPPPSPRLAPWIAAGVGIASAGVGTYFGLAARSLWQDARRGCDQSRACTDAAFAMTEHSHRDATIATAMFATAGAALVTGVVLYLASPREHAARVQVSPAVSSRAGGLTVQVGF